MNTRRRFSDRGRPGRALLGLVALLLLLAVAPTRIHAIGADSPHPRNATTLTGVIAYLTDTEIRVVNADGTDDRALWSLPTGEGHTLSSLAWSPSGDALAFTANHEAVCSRFDGDIYTIAPTGANLHRITNAPVCGALGALPHGSVEVTVQNTLVDFSIFAVHVEGAASAEIVTVPPGATRTVTLPEVADYGAGHQQSVTVISGNVRWFDPTVWVDVAPGETRAPANTLIIGSDGWEGFGARSVTWNADGTQLGFVLAQGLLQTITATPSPGTHSDSLFPVDQNVFGGWLAWSKTGDQVLYGDSAGIYLGDVTAETSGTQLIQLESAESVYGVEWLPDDSGFVFGVSGGEFVAQYSNVYAYDFADASLINLTGFTDEFAGFPSVSPDGAYIVFARADTLDTPSMLWILELATGAVEPLNVSGVRPAWAMPAENHTANPIYLPLIQR